MSYHFYFIAGDFDPNRLQAAPAGPTRPPAITLPQDHSTAPVPVATQLAPRPRPSAPVCPRPSVPVRHRPLQPVPLHSPTLLQPTSTTPTTRPPMLGPPLLPSSPPISSSMTSPAPPTTTVTDQAGQQFPSSILAVRPKSAPTPTRSRSPLPRRRSHPGQDRHDEQALPRPPGIWQDTDLMGVWSPYSPHQTPYSAFPLPTRPERAITTHETDFRAWLRQQQDPNHPMTSEQIKYVASHLCLAQLDIAQLRPLQVFDFDPTWTNPHCDNPTVQSYYVLPIPQFKSRLGFGDDIPPKPRRALRPDGSDAIEHIQLAHATSSGGLRGILTEAKLRPSKLHQTDSCSFFAIGYRKSFDLQHERWETARVLNSGWQANKNAAKILVLCLGWGDGKKNQRRR